MLTDLLVPGLGMLSALEEATGPAVDPFEPRMIPGGSIAPELCMLPVDMDPLVPAIGIIQPKPNGIRALRISGTIVSREGVPMNCARKAKNGLDRMEKAFREPMVFDGEWLEPGDFNATLRAFGTGRGAGVFWLFDAIPLAEWMGDRCTQPIEVRLVELRRALAWAKSPHVGMLWHRSGDARDVTAAACEEWARRREGIVVKQPGSLYQRRRSDAWQRWKETVTIDVTVMDQLRKDGTLRKIMVRGPEGPLTIGSGWSAADAIRLLEEPEALIEVEFNPMPGTGKPRHARFVRFRDDKGRRQS
jgi:ATP-dependent DNA ligase